MGPMFKAITALLLSTQYYTTSHLVFFVFLFFSNFFYRLSPLLDFMGTSLFQS